MSLDANTGTAAKTGGFSLGAMLRSPLALPLAGLIVVSILMGLASDNFFSVNNIMNVLRQVSVVGILAVGMTFVILTGGIDLSVGAVMALVGTLSAGLMVNTGLSPAVALPAGLFIGLGIGIFNGALVAWGKMPAIIVTLATMGMARGLGLIYSGGYPVSGIPSLDFLVRRWPDRCHSGACRHHGGDLCHRLGAVAAHGFRSPRLCTWRKRAWRPVFRA